jgi:hypothetical protein
MHATVRRYEGVTNPQEATSRVQGGFVPTISAMPGFVAYYWVDLGYGALLSVSVFDLHPNVIETDRTAARWIKTNLASLLTQEPRSEAGEVVAHKIMDKTSREQRRAVPADLPLAQRAQQLRPHLTVRRYEGVTDPQDAGKQVRESFVPVIAALPGFSAYYWLDLGQKAMLSVSVFDSFTHGVESGQTAAIWVRSHLAEALPKNPRIEAGRVVATA